MRKYGLWETYNAGQDEERIRNAVCPECGGREIMEGDLQAREGLAFVPAVQKTVIPRGCGVRALACKKCGAVFGFRLTNMEKILEQ